MQGAIFRRRYYLLDYATEHTGHAEAVVSTYFCYYGYCLEIPEVAVR
jgi:hypothetical protein